MTTAVYTGATLRCVAPIEDMSCPRLSGCQPLYRQPGHDPQRYHSQGREEYLRNCDYGMGEEDCWLFAIETVEDKLTHEQLCALAAT